MEIGRTAGKRCAGDNLDFFFLTTGMICMAVVLRFLFYVFL